MADDQGYSTFVSGEDEASRLLKKILSPAEAQSLVLPPPNHAPVSGPGESTPLTGSLAKPPSQATPSRAPAFDAIKPVTPEQSAPIRSGLARYFVNAAAPVATPDRSGDPQYVKVSSQGQVGYLPKTNLRLAQQIDRNLEVLGEG
jgi:hypothetical protein